MKISNYLKDLKGYESTVDLGQEKKKPPLKDVC